MWIWLFAIDCNETTQLTKTKTIIILLDYIDRALQTFRKDQDEDGRQLELNGAEVAALMNLVATDTLVEEAIALIPSLNRFPEAAIDEILDLIRNTMIRILS
jgi:DNA-directed RNA polymerase II subunit RPB4